MPANEWWGQHACLSHISYHFPSKGPNDQCPKLLQINQYHCMPLTITWIAPIKAPCFIPLLWCHRPTQYQRHHQVHLQASCTQVYHSKMIFDVTRNLLVKFHCQKLPWCQFQTLQIKWHLNLKFNDKVHAHLCLISVQSWPFWIHVGHLCILQ